MPSWDVRLDLRIDLSRPELVQAVARVEALAAVIHGLPVPPHLRDKLNRLNISRAVRGTTGIEGVEVTEDEVERILDAGGARRVLPVARAREEQEVLSAARAMTCISDVLDAAPDTPLTEAFIATIHRVMTASIDYEHNTPGVYRGHAVSAGSYVPPRTHDEVTALMAQFAAWLHGPRAREMPPAVRAIAAHFYFVSIHPFGDGNGRTARAIESFLLYQSKINALGFYSLSNFYYQHRDQYIDGLDSARFRTGDDLTPFILFSLRGLVDEINAVHAEVLREMSVIAFRDFAQQELLRTGRYRTKAGERMYELVTGVIEPVAIAAIAAGRHPLGATYRRLSAMTLRRDVAFLRELNLLLVDDGAIRANVALMNRA